MSADEPVDPADPTAVGAALVQWVSARFGGPVTLAEPSTALSGGFDSHLHSLRLEGEGLPSEWRGGLVVRVLPTADRSEQSEREAAVQAWAAGQGYAAPTVLAVIGADGPVGRPTQVMQRLPGTTLLEAVASRPWQARRQVGRLADLALRLHSLPTDGWPGPAESDALVAQRLHLPRLVAERTGDPDLAAALDRVDGLDPVELVGGPAVVCHGDFHPLNVMVDGDRAWVLDWTDAALGPPEGDVARTLLLLGVVASIAASSPVERLALRVAGPWLARRYRRAYEAGRALDPIRLRRWEALHALHGWAQVVMLHDGGFAGSSSTEGREDAIPLGLATVLQARVASALGA